ncbi:SpoIIE family protein phosphatase [Salidesulfovibrio brasiliensis]|uniref:SpoIIE family protein phosphatase n=1 Tax=Salidesulfovibrio brasiliensis TaxID=221711 RepID=UPI0006D1705C|nr:SpoIIE family protein phosphatase [Salidesulfovibrio brasiliensis]
MKRGIAFKISALALASTFIIFAAVLVYNYDVSRKIIGEAAETNARNVGKRAANRVASVVLPIQKAVDNLALALEDASLTTDEIVTLSRRMVESNKDIYGVAIAFEPYRHDQEELFFSPYHYRGKDGIEFTMLGGTSYRYFYMDWYQLPKVLGRAVWTEPYFDEGGGDALMATYSVPFYRSENGKRVLAGVCTADITLDWLRDVMDEIRLSKSAYSVILSRNGTYIHHPISELVLNQTIFSLAEDREEPAIREIGQDMIAGKTGFMFRKSIRGNVDSFLYYTALPVGGWSLAILFPKDEVLAGVNTLLRDIIVIGALGFLLLTGAMLWIARSISRPVRQLSDSAMEIAGGNLDAEIPTIETEDEVGDLADSFNHMRTSLKTYIKDLTETTASKERIESELRIAREIQMGILPKLFPAFPDRPEFDIYASIEPAKEVGGDLYDFFFVDDDHFCFLIGDVSGKGVPAAFFMAVTKTLLKVICERGLDPGAALEKVNNDLAEENESCMFVTLFLCVMNIHTGEVRYGSAGHNPPILIRSGEAEWIPPLKEPVAGPIEGMSYSTKTLQLSPGDTIFLYTDGVTEAMDNERTLYGEDRLMEHMKRYARKNAAEIVTSVDASIKEFTGGAEQSDDITMLAMRFNGDGPQEP